MRSVGVARVLIDFVRRHSNALAPSGDFWGSQQFADARPDQSAPTKVRWRPNYVRPLWISANETVAASF